MTTPPTTNIATEHVEDLGHNISNVNLGAGNSIVSGGGRRRQRTLANTILVEDSKNRIQKIIVGQQESIVPGPGKVLMLLGATGAGKSTLINGFVNYIMGVKYEDDYRYRLIHVESQRSQAYSQTKWITAYTFNQEDYPKLSYTFTIIDTPGYGDTEGLERDKEITKQIKEFFTHKGPQGIDHLDGIGFVVQSSLPRLTPVQRYIIESVLGIFGKDIKENIFIMTTFSDGSTPPVLECIKEAGVEFQQSFKYNNSALFPGPDDNEDLNQVFWKAGESVFKDFFRSFYQTRSVSLQMAKEVLRQREELECVINGLQSQMKTGLFILDQFQQEEQAMREHDKEVTLNKAFVYEVEVTKKRKTDLSAGEHATNCQICLMTCHKGCKVPLDGRKDFKCEAMNSQGNCEVCPRRCHWKHHKNEPFFYQVYTKKETRTLAHLRMRYEEAKVKKTEKEQIMDGLKKDLKVMYDAVFVMLSRAKSIIHRLSEIALRPNPLSELDYIDILIEKEKREAKEGWLRRVEAFNQVRKHVQMLANIKDDPEFQKRCETSFMNFWKIVQRQFGDD